MDFLPEPGFEPTTLGYLRFQVQCSSLSTRPTTVKVNESSTDVTVNRISVSKLEEMLRKQYNHDFNENAAEKKGNDKRRSCIYGKGKQVN